MVIGIAALGLSVYLFLRLGGPLVARLGPGAVAGITRIFWLPHFCGGCAVGVGRSSGFQVS
jgi:hypothetical protein